VEFSIAGLQDKFTCRFNTETKEIFLVKGTEATTHIVKVNPKWHKNQVIQVIQNEFFCLSLAKKIGLHVPVFFAHNTHSKTNPVLVLERYDRIFSPKLQTIRRVHQEDLCQAFGLPVTQKYEHEGGKSFAAVYELIRQKSSLPLADLSQLLQWLCFNFIVGNADSHSKNISILLSEKTVKLAPFYDILSTEVYGNTFRRKFAFQISGENECDKIVKKHILELETVLKLRTNTLLQTFHTVAQKTKNALQHVVHEHQTLFPEATIAQRVCEVIEKRLKHIEQFLKI
jgi:serine/threonine-protein kinase HipA